MLNSRGDIANTVPQSVYQHMTGLETAITRDVVKGFPAARQEQLTKFKRFRKGRTDEEQAYLFEAEKHDRHDYARDLAKAQAEAFIKAGVTTSLGYNFYDLRGPAFLLYPVNTPLRNAISRVGAVNAGVGTAAHWIATKNPGMQYIGVLEGQRNALATPDSNAYVATYKELGVERGATFTSQFAGEGYTDILADEHIRGLHEFMLGEEGMLLGGNSGTATGNNGFVLGTANTPVAALVTTSTGNVPAGSVSCRVVELTMLGNPSNNQFGYGVFPTVVAGLTPSYTRTNYDGSTTSVNGGMGAISAASNVVTADSTHKQATFTVTPKAGAVAWAWFVDLTDASAPSAANAILTAITTVPALTFNLAAAAGTQAGNAAGLSTDHSFNTADFDGLLAYAAQSGIWTNLYTGTNQGYGSNTAPTAATAGLTAQSNGRIKEFEQILAAIWQQFQAPVKTIWASADAKLSASDTILSSSGSIPTAYHFNYTKDGQNNITGGFVVSAYQSQYAMDPSGAGAIPIRIHPMLPPGTFYFDIGDESPYPQARVPWTRALLQQRGIYSIEWPLVTRQWTFGTYEHVVMAHMFPWITAVLTGVSPT